MLMIPVSLKCGLVISNKMLVFTATSVGKVVVSILIKLSFLLKCNYSTKKLNRNIPLFYIELLDFFKELKSLYNDCYSSILLLWNNENITIEGKSLYWKKLADKGVLFVQDLLNNNGNYLTYEDFKQKYGIDINFIYYFQLLAAIPSSLKTEGASTTRPLDSYLNDPNVFQLSEGKKISHSQRCDVRITTHCFVVI